MGMLSDGAAWLDQQRKEHLSLTVTYVSGQAQREVAATIGQTVFEVEGEMGVLVRHESRDYIISVDDLDSEPAEGDKIIEAGRIYEMMAPGGNPAWRYSDPFRKAYRIHTKYTGQES